MDLSKSRCGVDLLVDLGQHVGQSCHSDIDLEIGSNHIVHFPQIGILSFDSPQFTKPHDIIPFQLFFQEINFFQSLLNFRIVDFPRDRIRQKE